MMVSLPLTAPAWPPDTGASRNSKPRSLAIPANSRAMVADAVVWSTNRPPLFIAAKAPSCPNVTSRRAPSRPTQANTISAPCAASAGVVAALPLYSFAQACALAAVRLNTVTVFPARLKCPAIGYPITPRPMKETFMPRLFPHRELGTDCLCGELEFHVKKRFLHRFLHLGIEPFDEIFLQRVPIVVDRSQDRRRRRQKMQAPDPPVGGIGAALEKSACFQPVHQTAHRDGLDFADKGQFDMGKAR